MRERLYLIRFSARRFRWSPWPRTHFQFSKVTTWEEAHNIADMAAERNDRNIEILWWELENTPPELLGQA